jgi:ABC-type enterobactin transport system permease subunit
VLFSRYLMNACLIAGQWLFVGTSVLALVVILADWMRGDAGGRPMVFVGIAAGCLLVALLFFVVRSWLDRNFPQS